MSLSVNDLLEAIDNMDLYDYDYQVITKLLASGDNKMFTKILEEVVNGELLWADFDEYLANTNYPDIFTSNITKQEELERKLKLLIDFRKYVNSSYVYSDNTNSILLRNVPEIKDSVYEKEITRLKENALYRILSISPKDNEITIAMKNALYNAIRNNNIYLEHSENYTVMDGSIALNGESEYFDYVNPDDLLLYLDNAIIPLGFHEQELDDFDKEYMAENHLSEDQMKQFKSLLILFERYKETHPAPQEEEEENGGE